jgi:hypothetical protein
MVAYQKDVHVRRKQIINHLIEFTLLSTVDFLNFPTMPYLSVACHYYYNQSQLLHSVPVLNETIYLLWSVMNIGILFAAPSYCAFHISCPWGEMVDRVIRLLV